MLANPLGPYKIERELGGGRFAIVYLAFGSAGDTHTQLIANTSDRIVSTSYYRGGIVHDTSNPAPHR
jgi:hypothetical protein